MELLEKTSTPVYKWCPDCKQWKLVAEFHRATSRYDGREVYCKICKLIRIKHYFATERGREARRRYSHSKAGIAWRLAHSDYYREWYHRIQDEACHYYPPRTFHLAYRFIKALETAEVVEIKP